MRDFLRCMVLSTLVMVGCGDDASSVKPDAGGPDAPPDGPPGGAVTLTIKRDMTGVANVKVYFQNADSSLVAMTTTNASGVATAALAPGGFVTAVSPFAMPGDDDRITTFAGVKPGDQLELAEQTTSTSITVNVTVPVDASPRVAGYRVSTSCGESDLGGGGGAPTAGQLMLDDCNGMADVVVESQDANGIGIRAFYKANVAVTDNGTLAFTDAYQALETATFRYMNVPAGRGVSVANSLVTARGTVVEKQARAMAGAGGVVATIARPVVAGAKGINLTFVGSQGSNDQQLVGEWGPVSTVYTLDFAGVLLPAITTPSFDIATRAFRWTSTGTGQPDMLIANVGLQRANKTWSWEIAAPYSDGSLVLPALPADSATLNPAAGDTATGNEVTTAKLPGGYDAIRARAFSDGFESFLATPSGRVVLSTTQ